MKKLLNTLYVLTENSYLTLENENIVVNQETNKVAKIPLLTLESVICFNYPGASPQLIAACIKNGIGISFFSPSGKFYYRAQGEYINSSVLTRQAQYRIAENEDQKISYVKNMIIGKLYNSKEFIQKFAYNHNHQINENSFKIRINELNTYIDKINTSTTIDQIRGLEGKASQIYFDIFPNMILRDKDTFNFISRNRRPPVDPVNCLLSLAYTVLMHDCANACESVGLDPYLGFMHTSRPGRKSLALDLIEEFRAIIADRFVLYLINNQIIKKDDFIKQESGAIILTDIGKKKFFQEYQKQKKDKIIHPFLNEKLSWGLVPYSQALLLSRTIRNDLPEYPPFLWR